MIFNLNYVTEHPVYKLMEVLEIFLARSVSAHSFSLDLFPDWFNSVVNGSPKLNSYLIEVFNSIYDLTADQKSGLLQSFASSNLIEQICHDRMLIPSQIDNLPGNTGNTILKLVRHLFKSTLRSGLFEGVAGGNINDHFFEFMNINGEPLICPFCGLWEYPSGVAESRPPYDHYLSISRYPLSGVNFNNLVPLCQHCNDRTVKGDKNVLFREEPPSVRRLTYFPYSSCGGIRIEIQNIRLPSINDRGEWNISIVPCQTVESEKVETWTNIFKIHDRYKEYVQRHFRIWIKDFVIKTSLNGCSMSIDELKTYLREWINKQMPNRLEPAVDLKKAFFVCLLTSMDTTYLEGLRLAIADGAIGV
jgi:hypothetical protein